MSDHPHCPWYPACVWTGDCDGKCGPPDTKWLGRVLRQNKRRRATPSTEESGS